MGPDLDDVRRAALAIADAAPDGPGLDARLRALVALACASQPTTLDREGIARHARRALDEGAAPLELGEVVQLASSIGVHGLHEGSRVVVDVLAERGDALAVGPLPDEAQELRERIFADRYWRRLDEHLPGFVDAQLRLSIPAFNAFVDFVGVPWRTGTLPALTKELIYVGIDSTPTHRHLPGLRLHVGNCVKLGATRQQIVDVLDVAAAAGPAHGIE